MSKKNCNITQLTNSIQNGMTKCNNLAEIPIDIPVLPHRSDDKNAKGNPETLADSNHSSQCRPQMRIRIMYRPRDRYMQQYY
jgi:hypothetical protein